MAFASGAYTLTMIRDKMFSLGLVGARSGRALSLASVEHILRNPFYYGYCLYRGELYLGSHKPMISKKLFDQIQEALLANGKPRKKRGDKNSLYHGFAACGECGFSVTPEQHIKKSGLRFVYYRCTHKSRTQKCSQTRFLREEELTRQVRAEVQKVSLPDKWRDNFLNRLDAENAESRHSSDLFVQNLKSEILAVSARIQRLMLAASRPEAIREAEKSPS